MRVMLEPLVDESELIGLGDVIDAGTDIPAEKLRAVIDALQRQIGRGQDVGASRVIIVGTEPLRRASNADELIAAVERYTGHRVAVLTVHQEAELTFLGV